MHPFVRAAALVPPALIFALLGACSDANEIPDATRSNVVDTATLGAIEGTPISTPSGYNIASGPLRIDQNVEFEFAYNVRRLTDGSFQRVFVPRAALGLSATSANPGLQRRDETFTDITRAPTNGYVTDSAVPVEVGQRYLVRSRVICPQSVPLYAKLEILGFQDSTVTFQTLVNENCGYKDLLPGIPEE